MKKFTLLLTLVFTFTFLFSQTYQITFSGSGLSSSVTSVKVWNLTQDTVLTMGGSDTLRLVNTSSINSVRGDKGSMSVYPNPTDKQATISFYNPLPGRVVTEIYDLAGKPVIQEVANMEYGDHTYTVEGLKAGLYFVTVHIAGTQYSAKLVSLFEGYMSPSLTYSGSNPSITNNSRIAGALSIVQLPYNPGDLLMFKGISGNNSRVVMLVPTQSQNVDFEFVSCVDMNNQHYAVVTIGTQTWMAENLRATKYKNGTPIPHVSDPNIWGIQFTPAYCWYDNDSASSSGTYGALYKWFTIETGNLCPTGWHVPTQAEWTTLRNYLGGDSLTGGMMKETGNQHWDSPNTNATNASGFTALPGGLRAAGTGAYLGLGLNGNWWSATGYSTSSAYCYQLNHDEGNLSAVGNNKGNGFSVRCVKD